MSLRKPKRLLNYTSSIIFTSCYSNFWPFLVSISISPVSHIFGQTTKTPIFPELCGWISILKDFANDFKGPRFHYGDVLHAWHDIDFNKSLNLSPCFSKSKLLCSFSFSSHFFDKKKKKWLLPVRQKTAGWVVWTWEERPQFTCKGYLPLLPCFIREKLVTNSLFCQASFSVPFLFPWKVATQRFLLQIFKIKWIWILGFYVVF